MNYSKQDVSLSFAKAASSSVSDYRAFGEWLFRGEVSTSSGYRRDVEIRGRRSDCGRRRLDGAFAQNGKLAPDVEATGLADTSDKLGAQY